MINLIYKNEKITFFYFSIYIWLTLWPFFIWDKKYLIAFFFILSFLHFAIFILDKKIEFQDIVVFLATIILVSFFFIFYNASIAWVIMMGLSISVFFLLTEKNIFSIFNIFKKIFSISLIPGILLWIIHLIGVDISTFALGVVPLEFTDIQKVKENTSYIIFPGSVVLNYMLDEPLIRLQGMYDEPGVVGTLCALILLSERLKLNSFTNIIIFLAGIMSLSLAFYIMIFVYVFFNLKEYIYKILIICISLYFIYNILPIHIQQTIDSKIMTRLSIDENFNLKGYNRESIDSSNYDEWLKSDVKNLLCGLNFYIHDGSSSWKNILISTGIFGILIILIIYCFILLKVEDKFTYQQVIFIIIVGLSFLQRPNIIQPINTLIFFYAMYYLKKDYNDKDINLELFYKTENKI